MSPRHFTQRKREVRTRGWHWHPTPWWIIILLKLIWPSSLTYTPLLALKFSPNKVAYWLPHPSIHLVLTFCILVLYEIEHVRICLIRVYWIQGRGRGDDVVRGAKEERTWVWEPRRGSSVKSKFISWSSTSGTNINWSLKGRTGWRRSWVWIRVKWRCGSKTEGLAGRTRSWTQLSPTSRNSTKPPFSRNATLKLRYNTTTLSLYLFLCGFHSITYSDFWARDPIPVAPVIFFLDQKKPCENQWVKFEFILSPSQNPKHEQRDSSTLPLESKDKTYLVFHWFYLST